MAPKSATKKPAAAKTPAEQTPTKTATKTPKVGADGKPAKGKRHARRTETYSSYIYKVRAAMQQCSSLACTCLLALACSLLRSFQLLTSSSFSLPLLPLLLGSSGAE